MAVNYPVRSPSRAPTHPGEVLREEVLPALDLTVTGMAERLGVSRQALHAILNESTAVTPAMALRIGKLCGNGPRLWLHMQSAFDLWHAEREVDVSSIETLRVA